MSISFQKKFLNGLKNKYNLTMEDIANQDYKYIGGTPDEHNPQHYNQWLNIIAQKPHLNMPLAEQECTCGHKIKNNCFIMNKYDNIIVLGNCCIKRFIPKSGRTCGWCGNPHKNRKFNLCNTCKENVCKKCGKDKEEDYYKYCNKCYNNDNEDNISSSSSEEEAYEEVKKCCKGKGECFIQINFSNTYDKNDCEFNCELKNCIDCTIKYPEWLLDCNNGYCKNCSQELFLKGKKIYLYVPYNDKEDAKKYGCRWNPYKKKWFFYDKNDNKEYITNNWKLVE